MLQYDVNSKPSHFLEDFFNPKSIAFYGANEDLMRNMGTQELLNMLDNGYKGRIYPIHLRLDTVLGLKAYRSISELPETPDLTVVILPKEVIPQVFTEIGEKGVKNVVLVTAGFRETDNQKEEEEIKRISEKYKFRFLGPNCLGFVNTHTRYFEMKSSKSINSGTNNISNSNATETCILNITWINYKTNPGNVSIASQSGTFASHIFFLTEERDLNMNKCVSIGNEANIDICDCLEYFEQDPFTEVILLYIEEIKRGHKFIELAKRISPKKPIIALYVGGSEGGASAVSSHTGSMAGNDRIFNAAFEQSGIIRVYSVEELMDTAMLFSKMIPKGVVPKGKRLAVVTNAGGPGATMSDRASRLGLILPKFSEELVQRLRKFLPSTAQEEQASNPLDYTFTINPTVFFKQVPELIAKSGEADAIVCYGAYGPAFFSYQNFGNEFLKKPEHKKQIEDYLEFLEASVESSSRIIRKYKIPIIYINFLGMNDRVFNFLNKNGFPTFRMPHQAINAVKNLMDYGIFVNKLENLRNKSLLRTI